MKIILANPPWQQTEDNVYSKTSAIYPPLGLASMATVLRAEDDFEVEVLDAWALGMGITEFTVELKKKRPIVLGLTAYTITVREVLAAVREVKRVLPEVRVVLGGPHPTVRPEECITQEGVDFVVRGEGEITFRSLVQRIGGGDENFEGIPGLTYKLDGKIRHNPGQSFVPSLDDLPWPSREGLPMDIYRPSSGVYKRLPVASVITSRGCPFHCTFCSCSVFGHRVRFRSPEKVVGEIEYLIDRFGIREIYFADDCFTLERKRALQICDLLREKNFDLTWTCLTRVNLIDEELLRKMKGAGCVSIAYGIESADPEQLKKMKKNITIEQARKAIALTKRVGIETRTSYIFGMPGEDRGSLEKTLALSLELNSDFVIFCLATPRPGTELYDEAREKGLLLADGFDLYPLTDSAHCLIRLPEVSCEELLELYRRAYRLYYFRPSYIFSRLTKIRSRVDLRAHWRGLREYLSWQMMKGKL